MESSHAARLVMLEGALCSLLRETQQAFPFDAPDALSVHASIEDGQTVIEVEYLRQGVPVSGESL